MRLIWDTPSLQKAKAHAFALSVFTAFFTHWTTNHFLGAADALPTVANQVCPGKLSSTEAKWHEADGAYAKKSSLPSSQRGCAKAADQSWSTTGTLQQDCSACSSLHECIA